MNLTELARKLKVTTKELKAKLPELGFDIGARAIQIPDEQAEKVIEKWQKMKRIEQLRAKILSQKLTEETERKKKEEGKIVIPPTITVHDLAKKMNLPVTKVISELLKNGVLATINDNLDFEIAAIIAENLGFKVEAGEAETKKILLKEKLQELTKSAQRADKKKLVYRSPVVVVLGHVDHGKTSLLDAIRQTNVAAQEAGAITQHIGAYQVEIEDKEHNKRVLTFIDTPGHEAFNEMRRRGGQVADLAVLVVAADDKIQPQTLESIKVAQEANLPFVVAINKIDLPEADIERIKKGFSEINLVPEDWGGKLICVPVSAKTKKGLTELLEVLLLLAEMEKEKYLVEAEGPAIGTVIESHIDKGLGPVATVLIYAGQLKLRDNVLVGHTYGRIRMLKDFRGNFISEAGPGMPVQIVGLKDKAPVGDLLEVIEDVKTFKKRLKEIAYKGERQIVVKTKKEEKEAKNLKVILRADVVGSLEAIIESLKKLETSQKEIGIEVIKKDLGEITESDVVLAQTTKAWLVGFNVEKSPSAAKLAEELGVEIHLFKIIYDLIEVAKQQINNLVPVEIQEVSLGRVKVLVIFKKNRQEMIVGAKVTDGIITKGSKFRLWRAGQLIDDGEILQLQVNKQDVDEVKAGAEFGLRLSCKTGLAIDDELEIYREEKKERKIFE
jgi:translation initiation factor IF-2